MQDAIIQNIQEQTQVLESLQALLMDEQQVLRDGNYNRLNDITELKRVLLGKLEYLSGTEQNLVAATEEASKQDVDAHNIDQQRALLLQTCADLNVRNGIEINKNYAFVQGILHTMVGRQDSPVGYNQDGYQFDSSPGRLNATV
ncbi:MAG: flagellar biosynthesis/type III secretory pathway chaperone [Candidatus Azotimanducaceae bacterium]|jgi:flagellar biosynthesis/type III secretory pathway chaperone